MGENQTRRHYSLRSRLILLGVTVLMIVGIDRALIWYRPRIWEYDPVLLYRHRPGVEQDWGVRYANRPLRINRYGHHDDEFPTAKPPGELRGVVLGDSIVMGHGMTVPETFVNQLEQLLQQRRDAPCQVINTGVQGYSTFQYEEVLRRSLKFEPDFVVVGFCMNDVTEPLIVNADYGGTGWDYHGVLQTSRRWLGFLANETGFGRLASHLRGRTLSAEEWQRREMYSVREMALNSRTNETFIEAWKRVLADFDGIIDLARQEQLPLLVVIFPHAFQLGHERFREPQRIVREHVEERGVPCLDMSEVTLRHLREGVWVWDIFLDQDHYTVEGNTIVAEAILEEMVKYRLLPAEP